MKNYTTMLAGVALCAAAGVAQAQSDFPQHPIEMTILFGGSAQTVGQVLAEEMSKLSSQPVVAVSRPGGGGAVGYSYAQATEANGYNIVWNSNSISTVYYQGNLPFDYKAFTPIARVGVEVPVVAVRSNSGWNTLEALAAGAKQRGTPLRVGVSGLGSFTHLVSAALFNQLGVPVVYVPYGEGRAPAELLAGRVDVAIQWPSQFQSHVRNGTLTLVCSTGIEKIEAEGAVPTCAEAGAKGMNITMWRGLVAPAGTPPEVVEKLEETAKQAVESAAFKKTVVNLGFTPAYLPAQEFGELIAKDDAVISDLMSKLGMNNR
ncbi:tripartite tricarboxylate transporter substrate binding protein [Pseudaminobacter arsenicus]|uniref:Tripartite tricarboxylate transporter substrate binding protein n=1 Tax=Borborobacter arsenicus TaxID=1851146 RepID=A0A432V0K3_9HYPH|nr:tripartite tricarboxylate transporter substrate binding protein [Pseudaminobacter arsenicus]RUM95615.1 tripartite tricarboxylate transporter substrate binding protein [Pseudaminobacter arsenicus]